MGNILFYILFTAPADYSAINAIDNLPAGTGNPGNTVFCQTLLVQDDNIAEGLEDLSAQLASLSPFVVVNQPSLATIQILDDDSKLLESVYRIAQKLILGDVIFSRMHN